MHKCYEAIMNHFYFFKTVYCNNKNVVEIRKQTNNDSRSNMKKFI